MQGPKHSTQEFKGEMTLHDLRMLVLWSFKYSRGNGDIQESMLRFIRNTYPKWKIRPRVHENLLGEISKSGTIVQMGPKMFAKHNHPRLTESQIKDDLKMWLNTLAEIFKEKPQSITDLANKSIIALLNKSAGDVERGWPSSIFNQFNEIEENKFIHPFFRKFWVSMYNVFKTKRLLDSKDTIETPHKLLISHVAKHIQNGGKLPTVIQDYLKNQRIAL